MHREVRLACSMYILMRLAAWQRVDSRDIPGMLSENLSEMLCVALRVYEVASGSYINSQGAVPKRTLNMT